MTLRLLLLLTLGLAGTIAGPLQSQQLRPQPPSLPGLSLPLALGLGDAVWVAPVPRWRITALGALLAAAPARDSADVACPMPVQRLRPSIDDGMPVLKGDSTTAPAATRSLAMPSCDNPLFERRSPTP